jgi:hypothetical protein
VLNFDPALDPRLRNSVTVRTAPVPVEPVVTAAPLSSRRGYTMRPDAEWTWEDVRDFVVAEIERCHGRQPRDPVREASTFRGFVSRWGPARAAAIARFAFAEPQRGYWHGAPIATTRFTKGSDEYFARPIAEALDLT